MRCDQMESSTICFCAIRELVNVKQLLQTFLLLQAWFPVDGTATKMLQFSPCRGHMGFPRIWLILPLCIPTRLSAYQRITKLSNTKNTPNHPQLTCGVSG